MREVARDEASFASGFPVTTPERTIFDLMADEEDLSLVANALHSACAGSRPFDFNKLEALIHGKYGKNKANQILMSLLADAGIAERGRRMAYKSAAALEMAAKEAAETSAQDTSRAISGFYFRRLLCRVFADGSHPPTRELISPDIPKAPSQEFS